MALALRKVDIPSCEVELLQETAVGPMGSVKVFPHVQTPALFPGLFGHLSEPESVGPGRVVAAAVAAFLVAVVASPGAGE